MLSFKNLNKKAIVSSCLKKFVVILLAFLVPFTQILPYPVAYAVSFIKPADSPNNISTVYDLVALVVDTKLDLDKTPYIGLSTQYQGLSKTTLGSRIMRYAEDIVAKNPLTDVKVIFYNSNQESVHDLASALENLYINGDGTRSNRLAGAVFIGDIPLPVVNKNGNRYVSMFPYTDFEDKAYTYDFATKSFIRNESVGFPRAEIWHGIIKRPTNNVEGSQKLAEYFDKNHLYHGGEDEFAKFDKKLFFGDLVHEEEKISPDLYKYYLRYLAGLEDLAYLRYNKFWANEVASSQMEGLPDSMSKMAGSDSMSKIPDVQTKYIIDNALTPYVKLLKQYVAQINDWADYTGRYSPTDISSVPVLITMKDEFAKEYLKSAGDALETKINTLVDAVQEPIPILESSKLTGNIGGDTFQIELNEDGGKLPPNMYEFDLLAMDVNIANNTVNSLYYKYHYKNEVSQKTYINGIELDILNSPKQCLPYLGSTLNEYFDADLNFNPKAVGGEYSVLTRALRSDNPSTAMAIRTAGVNTRLLSPAETYSKTDGKYGAKVENGQIIYGTYSDGQLLSGAIIEDNPAYGISAFEPNPMADDYKNVLDGKLQKGDIISSIRLSKGAENFDQYMSSKTTFDTAIENVYKKAKSVVSSGAKEKNDFTIYFFRGGTPKSINSSFTVVDNSELATKQDGSEGAIFTLYGLSADEDDLGKDDADHGNGYGNQGFDNSAGCNAANTMYYSDRCLYPVASMPVLDPAGAVALAREANSNTLKFPENHEESSGDEEGDFTVSDYENHTWIFQYPADKEYSEIDDVYMNGCYAGMPAFETTEELYDSNAYKYPLDPENKTGSGYPAENYYLASILGAFGGLGDLVTDMFSNPKISIKQDFYGRFLNKIGNFVAKGGDGNDDSWKVLTISENEDTGEEEEKEENLSGADPKTPPSAGEVWDTLKNMKAEDIVLNTSPPITIKFFSDRYGLFDGIDNDKDGVIDNIEEANSQYGIDPNNLNEIARKLFSKTRTYTVPEDISPIVGKAISLNVMANHYAGNLSIKSTILHNEPTAHTIYQQVKSMGTSSLPIDNPRYVAFQSKPSANQTIGKTEKIYYPNLFEISDGINLSTKIKTIADEIVAVPGAIEKLISKAGTNSPAGIVSYVETQLLSVLDMETLADSIKWNSSNIDEKHRYILKHYLNPNEKSFIKDTGKGFEAAYLVFDGSTGNSFTMAFNKDLSEDSDPLFSPLNIAFGEVAEGWVKSGEEEEDEDDDDESKKGKENFFVPLPKFIVELKDFVSAFGKIPSFGSCCGGAADMKKQLEEKLAGPLGELTPTEIALANEKPLDRIFISADKTNINANGSDVITLSVLGVDEDGEKVGKSANGEILSLNISQNTSTPVVTISSMDKTILEDGTAVFRFMNGGNQGLANISVTSASGKTSNTVGVTAIANNVKLISFVYFVPEGLEEFQSEIEGILEGGGEGSGDGDGDGDGGDGSSGGGAGDGSGDGGAGDGSGDGGAGDGSGDGGAGDGSGDSGAGDGSGDGGSGDGSGDGGAGDGTGDDDDDDSVDSSGDGSDKIGRGTSGSSDFDQGDLSDTLDSLSDEKDKKITVLVSDIIDETVLQSELVEDSQKDPELEDVKDWTEYYSLTEYYLKFIDELPEDEQDSTPSRIWEEEYSIDNYYQKYISEEENLESFNIGERRLLASIFSDISKAVPNRKVFNEFFNPFIDAETNPNSPYVIENGDKMVADGKALMKITAQVLNADGGLDLTPRRVEFSIIEEDVKNMVSFVNGPVVNSKDGLATVYIRAGTKTGLLDGHFKIRATVKDGDFPIIDKDLYLFAGDPHSIAITADSGILLANNQSKTKVYFTVKDRFGNICKNTFSQIGIFAKKDHAYFDEQFDANGSILGLQVSTMEGVGSAELYAKDSLGNVKVLALLFDSELEKAFLDAGDNWRTIDFSKYIGSSKTFAVADKSKAKLRLTLAKNTIPLNGSTTLKSELLYNGNVVGSYNGPIKFTNLNDKVADLPNKLPQTMKNGVLDGTYMPINSGTLAGEAEILVEIPGFLSDSVKVRVLPNKAEKIELSGDITDYIYTKSDNVLLKATLLDEYGNVVDNDSSTVIKFNASTSTEKFIQFIGAKSAVALKGVATTTIKGGDVSGIANISAADSTGKIRPGIFSIKVVDRITNVDAKEFSPRALYMSILGGAFGDPILNSNFSQTFLYDTKARVQAITSLTATPDDYKRIFGVDTYGKVSLISQDVSAKVAPATDSFPYQRIAISDGISQKELASIFLVPQNGLSINTIGDNELPGSEGIFVKQLSSDDPLLVLTKKKDGIYLEQSGFTKAKIDVYGRISLSDESYGLRLPFDNENFASNDFSIVITQHEEPIALVSYKQISGNVKTLPYENASSSFYPGIYVQLKSPLKRYGLIPSFSGSSTAEAKGIYLVDKDNPIESTQAPGFSYLSTEKAKETAGIGFDGANKHMLFFAAGNSVGESHLPYASEVGIIYGDPTVRLKPAAIIEMVSQFSGFNKTIGKPLFYGDEPILKMMEFDYNGDGYDDLLLLYESGYVRLLENENSNKRFKDRGFVLNIPGGAFSGTKIDVNNDGYDDLIVGTKESCKKGEECLSLFTNVNGHFERQTLNLAVDGKIYEMKVGDANADGCEDLFTSDSAGNIRIFYNKNDGKSCKGLNTNHGFSKNFGFAIDNNKNTAKSLYIYHSSVEQIYQDDIVLKTAQAEEKDLSSSENINDDLQAKMDLEKAVQKNSTKFFRFTIPSTQLPTASASDPDLELNAASYAQSATAFQQALQSNQEAYEKVIPQQTYDREYNFIKISEYTAFKNSTKYGLDINGQFANVGDEIQYDITLKNSTPNSFTNVMISDGTPAAMELLKDSLKCMDSNCPDNLQWVETGVQLRSQIIKGISIPANGSRKIQYKFKLNSVPKVNFNVGKDFAEYPSNKKDSYLDIMVRPEFKADKNVIMTHLYSTGLNSQNHVVYQKMDIGPETDKSQLMQDQFANNGMPLDKLMESAEAEIATPPKKPWYYLASQKKWEKRWWKNKANRPKIDSSIEESIFSQLSNLTVDSNFNGLPNSWDGVTDNIPGQGITTCPSPSAPPGQPENPGQSGGGSGSSSWTDKLPNSLSEVNGLANNVAGAVEGILNSLRCAGAGCLPIPYNYAFLAPHIAAPGIALFAFGVPFIPFFSPMYPSVAPSTVRFYTIPTLSGGLVISLCVGPAPVPPFVVPLSPCWAFAVPVGMLGICPDFAGAISDAVATAKNAVNSATGGTIAISSDGSDPSGSEAAADSDMISAGGALFDPESPIQAGASTNIRIPGFPAVITDWLDRQIAEVYNKLLDLPDIYFVYPDFGSLGPEFSNAAKNFKNNRGGWNSVHDFLTAVNSLPFITIEGKEVLLKVPTIPRKEIEKYKSQAREWLEHFRAQMEFWDCDAIPDVEKNNLCQKLKVDITGFAKGIESMLDTLDKISNLPYEILKWKNWEAKYATQIICYLDAIMTMIGGYIKKQMKIVGAWIEMIEEVIRIFKSWKMILDLVVEYQVSCDECKNDRFSLLGLLLQLFVVIPSPPIIPLPKWPDLVFDVSQIHLGMNITWPDIVFKPEPIYLPDIPFITIPIIPDLNLKLPPFSFDLPLPQLPDLPDLPPLPIPKLPDLPRPPKIPALPDVVVNLVANIKPILKILCLLKKGLIPVPEWSLATEAETLTQPNVDIVLSLLAALSFQLPAISYDYVKEIRVTAELDVSINADPIYNVVKLTADKWNIFLKNIVSKFNEISQYPIQSIIDEALEKLMIAAMGLLTESISNAFKDKDNSDDIKLEDLSEEELEQLKNSLGVEKFNTLMQTLNSIDNPYAPTDPDLFMDSSGNLIQRLPTGSFPIEEKIAPDTLSTPESEEIKTTFNDLSDYAPATEIKENVTAFSKTIQDFVENMELEETPSVYHLTATETYLDKDSPILNRSLDQIKKDIIAQDLPKNPEMDRLVALRESLISYTENLEKSNSTLLENVENIDSFGKILVQTNQSKDLKLIADLSTPTWANEKNHTYIASNSSSDSENLGTNAPSKISFFDNSVIKKLQNELDDSAGKLLAANITPQLQAAQTASDPATSAPAVAPKGLFVIADGKNENILNYTSELSGKTNMIFMDVDNDGDEDLVYSMGGDVYIKENYKNIKNKSKGKVISVSGKNNSVSSYVNKGGNAVQGVFAPSDNNESADIEWKGSGDPNIVAYEIILRNSIYENMNSPLFSYIALVNPPDHDSSVNILKKLKMNPPVDGEENPKVFEMSSPTSGSISIKIPNGNYYATVFAMDKDMNKSLPSEFAITSPQVCADKEAPFPAIDSSYRVPIMKEFELDASNSFDANGKIIEYYLEPLPYSSEGKPVTALPLKMWSDVNVMFDSDGDGVPWNDKSNPKFKIGPFTKEGDVGVREFVLHVVDQSGNSSAQKFSLEVFVPNISLDETLARDPIVTGQTDPLVDKMPFSLMRKRFIYRCVGGELKLVSRLKKIATSSISPQQKYYTDDSGNYKIMDLVTKDIIIVENSSGVVVAEINPKTGDIGITKEGYSAKVNEAVPPQTPTSVDIIDANGNVLGSVYVISDANADVTLHQNFVFETAEFMTLSGVHVSDLYASDDFEMKKFPTNDPRYPGGAGLVYLKENKYLAFIDTSGNIVLSDPRASLAQKKNNHEEDPLILEIRFNDKAVVEVYISSMKSGDSGILVGPNDVPYTSPRAPSDIDLYGSAYKKGEYMPGTLNILDQFIGPIPTTKSPDDIDKDIPAMIDDFYKRGLIGDILAQSGFKLDLNNAVTRAEFVNILLNMLCIIPRQPEAYVSYSAGEGFSDMRYSSGQIPWFFPYIKEAAMDDRQLVDGYRGPGDLDPITGLPPFRPERNITRAEATKIIIRALVMQGVLDGSKIIEVTDGETPWYESYIKASVDLTGYLKTGADLKEAFILTPAEAQFPNKKLTFKDLLTMTLRVIRLYDCWIIDADGDGISDFWEKKYGIDDPNADPDGDGLTNLQEFEFGSSPVDADTDGGGALDGDEYKWGTNPLDPFDDPFDNDGDGLTNLSETLIYKTDPNNSDTDGGCASDGMEVSNNTNPLDPSDDGANCNAPAEDVKEGAIGLYIVPAECNTCPCISTFDHKADIIPTDVMFSIISNFDETHIFSKSNEVPIDSVILK